jgi:hypothetical protein
MIEDVYVGSSLNIAAAGVNGWKWRAVLQADTDHCQMLYCDGQWTSRLLKP